MGYVDYEVKGREEKSVSFSNDDVTFINVPAGLEASLAEDFNLTFSVFSDDAENFAKSDIELVIDLKGLATGNHDVPISAVNINGVEGATVKDDLESFTVKVSIL